MIEDLDYLAAAHVLGVLEGVEAAQAQSMTECDPEFCRAVSGWEKRLLPLLEAAEEEPPVDMWQRISAALDREPPVRPPATRSSWRLLEPGVHAKILWENSTTGEKSVLIKMDPGSAIGAHEHDREEVCVVLKGSVVIDDMAYATGDTHTAPANSSHHSVRSAQGAIMLLRWAAKAA